MNKEYEVCGVSVDYDKSFEEMIDSGQYDKHDEDIISKRFPINKNGVEDVEIIFICRNKRERASKLIYEMEQSGYRPVAFEELLAIGEQHPEIQLKFPIIGLGTVVNIGDEQCCLCLNEYEGERRLDLHWFNFEWENICSFAFVKV